MSTQDRIEAEIDQAKGKGKEAIGELTDNERMEREGKLDQAKGDAKEAFEKGKDAVQDLKD